MIVHDHKMSFKVSVFTAFAIFTPIMLLFSYFLTIYVDENFKDFAYELDIAWRKNKKAS